MKKILYAAVLVSLLSLAAKTSLAEKDDVALAKKDDVEAMLQSYMPQLQQQWMEVKDIKTFSRHQFVLPRQYVAVSNLDQANHGLVTLHIRQDYPDDSAGYASLVTTYLVDCKNGTQRYIGLTMYDTAGNEIGQKFADKLNKAEAPYGFTESPQGHYCSKELVINLLTQGGFLSDQDQAILDKSLQDIREAQTQAIQDKNLEIPKVNIEKYMQLVEQELKEKESKE